MKELTQDHLIKCMIIMNKIDLGTAIESGDISIAASGVSGVLDQLSSDFGRMIIESYVIAGESHKVDPRIYLAMLSALANASLRNMYMSFVSLVALNKTEGDGGSVTAAIMSDSDVMENARKEVMSAVNSFIDGAEEVIKKRAASE